MTEINWTPNEVVNRISEIEAAAPGVVPFIKARYPYTYAYDYIRSHAEDFGISFGLSRAECAGLLHGNPYKEDIVRYLADAYLREHNIRRL